MDCWFYCVVMSAMIHVICVYCVLCVCVLIVSFHPPEEASSNRLHTQATTNYYTKDPHGFTTHKTVQVPYYSSIVFPTVLHSSSYFSPTRRRSLFLDGGRRRSRAHTGRTSWYRQVLVLCYYVFSTVQKRS